MKTRLTFQLDLNNMREVGPYYMPMWDMFVREGYVGHWLGCTDAAMRDKFGGTNSLLENILNRLQRTPKYSYA